MDETIALQTLGMPLADFFENRNNYISVLFQIKESSDGTIGKSCFFADILQFLEEETTLGMYIGSAKNLLNLNIYINIVKDNGTNTFSQALLTISPIE